MARFCVFAATANPRSDRPTHHIARTHAESLVRYGWAIEVGPRAIQLLYISEQRSFIPERMPPLDLPGLKFVEPTSSTWRLQHRNRDYLALR